MHSIRYALYVRPDSPAHIHIVTAKFSSLYAHNSAVIANLLACIALRKHNLLEATKYEAVHLFT